MQHDSSEIIVSFIVLSREYLASHMDQLQADVRSAGFQGIAVEGQLRIPEALAGKRFFGHSAWVSKGRDPTSASLRAGEHVLVWKFKETPKE